MDLEKDNSLKDEVTSKHPDPLLEKINRNAEKENLLKDGGTSKHPDLPWEKPNQEEEKGKSLKDEVASKLHDQPLEKIKQDAEKENSSKEEVGSKIPDSSSNKIIRGAEKGETSGEGFGKEKKEKGKVVKDFETSEEVEETSSEEDFAPSFDEASLGDDESAVEAVRRFMAEKLRFIVGKKSDEIKKKKITPILDEVSVDGIVRYMKSDKCKKVIVMAGAGISTSAGIPDFRSPGSGLYDNLTKYKLPHPQAIFSIDFFVENPIPFFHLAKELFPGSYKPTTAHYFVRLLHEKDLLLRHYTQNIDGLEKVAGIPAEKIVEAHGTFYTSHCLGCKRKYSLDWMKEKIFSEEIPQCEDCNVLVKPDIVFFGENLPDRFFYLSKEDFPKANLLIVMGSSLAVQPFASLVDRVDSNCPRILLNRVKAGHKDKFMSIFGMGGGLDLDSDKNYRDVAFLGDCDDLCRQLVEKLGWTKEFEELISKCEGQKDYLTSKVSVVQFLNEDNNS